MIDHTNRALSRVIWQYRNSPQFLDWIAILPDIAQVSLEEPLQQVLSTFDLDNANSWQLDIIGAILGQPRSDKNLAGRIESVLELSDGTLLQLSDDSLLQIETSGPITQDAVYRVVLKSKIYQNNGDARIDNITNAVDAITDTAGSRIEDTQDMEFLLFFGGPISPAAKALLTETDIQIIPRPQGVRIAGFIEPQTTPFFGFDGTGSEEPAADVDGFSEINFAPNEGGHLSELFEVT